MNLTAEQWNEAAEVCDGSFEAGLSVCRKTVWKIFEAIVKTKSYTDFHKDVFFLLLLFLFRY